MVVPLTESDVRTSMEDHNAKLNYLNNEIAALKMQLANGFGGGGGEGKMKALVHPKFLSPDKFSGPRGNVSFRQWSQDIKDLVARFSANLLSAMERLE